MDLERYLESRIYGLYENRKQPEVITMSIARATAECSKNPPVDPDLAFVKTVSLIEDGSTVDLLEKLASVNEKCLGIVPDNSGKHYAVFYRAQNHEILPLHGVYFMDSEDCQVYGVYKGEITGIFNKQLTLTGISEDFDTRTIVADFKEVRYTDDPDLFISIVATASAFDDIYPENPHGNPAYCLSHWWLPMRMWLFSGSRSVS